MMRIESRGWMTASLLLVACGTSEPKEPIQIGLVASLEDEDGVAGDLGIAELAIEEINRAGGINGHLLVLNAKDEGEEPEDAAGRIQELFDEGAVGAIGWSASSWLDVAYPFARDLAFPIMSPSSTAPKLSSVNDGGYMFRAVANDSVQSIAMVHYMKDIADPAIAHVALVFEEGPYGRGLADAFQDTFEKAGGTVEGRVTYTSGDPGASEDAAAAVVDDIAALPSTPTWIVLVSGEEDDAGAILTEWGTRRILSDVRWFLTDGVRSSGVLIPEGAGIIGTAPTFPTLGDAYGVLRDAYAAKFPDFQLDQESFAPNLWDSVFLFAAALAAQEAAGETFGGQGLRDRLSQMSKGPGLIFHAGQWRDITGTLSGGADIDFDGASGPFDLDGAGEPIGPYEVWRIVPAADSFEFAQVVYIDAKKIGSLRGQ
jgi:ABC-type branched-subunit amino acid transport system substrate-binding protein